MRLTSRPLLTPGRRPLNSHSEAQARPPVDVPREWRLAFSPCSLPLTRLWKQGQRLPPPLHSQDPSFPRFHTNSAMCEKKKVKKIFYPACSLQPGELLKVSQLAERQEPKFSFQNLLWPLTCSSPLTQPQCEYPWACCGGCCRGHCVVFPSRRRLLKGQEEGRHSVLGPDVGTE